MPKPLEARGGESNPLAPSSVHELSVGPVVKIAPTLVSFAGGKRKTSFVAVAVDTQTRRERHVRVTDQDLQEAKDWLSEHPDFKGGLALRNIGRFPGFEPSTS